MPRTMRVEYADTIYHDMNRSDRREDVFVDDVDRQDFPMAQRQRTMRTTPDPTSGLHC